METAVILACRLGPLTGPAARQARKFDLIGAPRCASVWPTCVAGWSTWGPVGGCLQPFPGSGDVF